MLAIACAAVIAAIHFYTFFLESIAWGRPSTNKIFAMREAEAEANRTFAFNQGFYNLFLAIAIVAGLGLKMMGREIEGDVLVAYGAFSVLGAGLVLFASGPGRSVPAMIQGLPALAYFGFRVLGY